MTTHPAPHATATPPSTSSQSHAHAQAPAVSLRNVSKRFGKPGASEVVALAGVSLDVPRGEFTAIMGPSGSGKSTLMHCLAGLDRVSSGTVTLGDRDITGLRDRDLTVIRRREVGFIFQAFNLIPTLSAIDNVRLPIRLDGRSPSEEGEARIAHLMRALGLDSRAGHLPSELSGGQQQRVAIARALATRPRVVIADEPTGNLDSRTGAEVLRLLRTAADESGQTIVMVTHDSHAASIADRVVFLVDGRIAREERGLGAAEIAQIMFDQHELAVAR